MVQHLRTICRLSVVAAFAPTLALAAPATPEARAPAAPTGCPMADRAAMAGQMAGAHMANGQMANGQMPGHMAQGQHMVQGQHMAPGQHMTGGPGSMMAGQGVHCPGAQPPAESPAKDKPK